MPQAPFTPWALWPDSAGNQHKCFRQKLLSSCVPACMAMIARSVSPTHEKYEEQNARTHLRSVMPTGTNEQTFNDNGISLKYVPDAFRKIQITTAIYRPNVAVDAAYLRKNFTLHKPGIVGLLLTTGNIKHAVVCKGEISPGVFLFLCPGYGPHEVPIANLANFTMTDIWQLGLPPTNAVMTGDLVVLI